MFAKDKPNKEVRARWCYEHNDWAYPMVFPYILHAVFATRWQVSLKLQDAKAKMSVQSISISTLFRFSFPFFLREITASDLFYNGRRRPMHEAYSLLPITNWSLLREINAHLLFLIFQADPRAECVLSLCCFEVLRVCCVDTWCLTVLNSRALFCRALFPHSTVKTTMQVSRYMHGAIQELISSVQKAYALSTHSSEKSRVGLFHKVILLLLLYGNYFRGICRNILRAYMPPVMWNR